MSNDCKRLIAAGQLRLVYVGLVRNQSIEADKAARSLFITYPFQAVNSRSAVTQMLLSLAQLVGFFDPTQALALAQEAVAKDGDNPAILVVANAVTI